MFWEAGMAFDGRIGIALATPADKAGGMMHACIAPKSPGFYTDIGLK